MCKTSHLPHKRKQLWSSFIPGNLFGEQTAEVSGRKLRAERFKAEEERRISSVQVIFTSTQRLTFANLLSLDSCASTRRTDSAHSCCLCFSKVDSVVLPSLPVFGYYLRLQLIPDLLPPTGGNFQQNQAQGGKSSASTSWGEGETNKRTDRKHESLQRGQNTN